MKHISTLIAILLLFTESIFASGLGTDSTKYYQALVIKEKAGIILKSGDVKRAAAMLLESKKLCMNNSIAGTISKEIDQCLSDIYHNYDIKAIKLASEGPYSQANISNCGNYMAVSNSEKTILLYDLRNGTLIDKIGPFNNYIFEAIPNINEGRIYFTLENDVIIYDLYNRSKADVISNPSRVSTIDLSPDNKYLAICMDGFLYIQELASKQIVFMKNFDLQTNDKMAYSVSFTQDGKNIMVYTAKGMKMWDIESAAEVKMDFTGNKLDGVWISDNKQYLVTGDEKNVLSISDITAGKSRILDFISDAYIVKPDNTGKYLAVANKRKGKKNRIEIWDIESKSMISSRYIDDAIIFNLEFVSGPDKIVAVTELNILLGEGVPEIYPMKHNNNVLDLKISPDNSMIATAAFDSTARIWDAGSGKPIIEPIIHKNKSIAEVNFSPCSKYLLTRYKLTKNEPAENENYKVSVWECRTGKELPLEITHNRNVKSASFSPCGKYIITTSGLGANIWEFGSGTKKMVLQHRALVNYAEYSSDGNYIVTASSDKSSVIWNARTGEKIKTLVHENAVLNAKFSPNSNYLATVNANHKITIWKVADGKEMSAHKIHNKNIGGLAFSSDSRLLATSSGDSTIVVWDIVNGKTQFKPVKLENKGGEIDFINKDSMVAVAVWDGNINVYNAQSGDKQPVSMRHARRADNLKVSHNGEFIATGSLDRTAHIWKMKDAKQIKTELEKDKYELDLKEKENYNITDNVTATFIKSEWAFLQALNLLSQKDSVKAKEILATQLRNGNKGEVSKHATDLLMKIMYETESQPINIGIKDVLMAKVSSCNNYIIVSSKDNNIYVLDSKSLKVVYSRKLPGLISAVVIGNYGNTFITVTDFKEITVWETESGKTIGNKIIHPGVVRVETSYDGKMLVTCSDAYDYKSLMDKSATDMKFTKKYDNEVKVWDLKSGKQIGKTLDFTYYFTIAKFTRNNRDLFTLSPADLPKLWDINKGPELKYILGESSGNMYLGGLSACGNFMVLGFKNVVTVIDIATGKPAYTPLIFDSNVTMLNVSPCGTYFTVTDSSKDKKVKFYRMADGKKMFEELNFYTILSVKYNISNNGRLLFEYGGTNRIYDVSTGNAITPEITIEKQSVHILDCHIFNSNDRALITIAGSAWILPHLNF